MTVWVVSHAKNNDLSKAEIYGPKRFVNVRYVYPDDLVGDQNRISDEFMPAIYRAVAEFNPSRDYVLIVGDNLQLLQFTSLIAKYHGSYRVLRYSREPEGYFPVLIEIGTKHGQEIGEKASSYKVKGAQGH